MTTLFDDLMKDAEVDKFTELRDGFAKAALQGGLEQGVENNFNTDWWHDPMKIARRAYAIADAMMKARDE